MDEKHEFVKGGTQLQISKRKIRKTHGNCLNRIFYFLFIFLLFSSTGSNTKLCMFFQVYKQTNNCEVLPKMAAITKTTSRACNLTYKECTLLPLKFPFLKRS